MINEVMVVQQVGQRIRALRTVRHLSMNALAEAAGLQYRFYADVERGKRNPTVRTLAKIAAGLKVPLTELVRTGTLPKSYGKADARQVALGRLLSELTQWKTEELRTAARILREARRWRSY